MALWKIRPIEKEDAIQLGVFTHLIYGDMWKRAWDGAYYQWKFYSEGLPQPNGRVAAIGGDIVGFQSSCHRRFRFGPRVFWSTELSDAMTDPDYRRQGMWSSIARQVTESAIEREFMPVTGFPNKYAYPGWINKFGMDHFFNLWRLALALRPPPIASKPGLTEALEVVASAPIDLIRRAWTHIGCRIDQSIDVERDCKVGEWVDQLWKEERGRIEAGVVRDADYLCWRFEKNPDEYTIYLAKRGSGKPLGFLVTKTRKKERNGTFAFIADMLIPSRDRKILHRLLYEAEKDFRKAGAVLVDAWTTSIPFYLHSLLSYGFFPVARLPFIIPVPQANFLRDKGWGSSRRWVLTMGDSDNI